MQEVMVRNAPRVDDLVERVPHDPGVLGPPFGPRHDSDVLSCLGWGKRGDLRQETAGVHETEEIPGREGVVEHHILQGEHEDMGLGRRGERLVLGHRREERVALELQKRDLEVCVYRRELQVRIRQKVAQRTRGFGSGAVQGRQGEQQQLVAVGIGEDKDCGREPGKTCDEIR